MNKIKTITFSNYIETKKNMSNKNLNKIFMESWKETPQGKEYYIEKENIKKGVCLFAFLLLVLPTVTSNLMIIDAFAGVEELQALKNTNPNIVSKTKEAVNFYKKTTDFFGGAEDKYLFINVIKEFLNNFEIMTLLEAAKGVNFSEFIKIITNI